MAGCSHRGRRGVLVPLYCSCHSSHLRPAAVPQLAPQAYFSRLRTRTGRFLLPCMHFCKPRLPPNTITTPTTHAATITPQEVPGTTHPPPHHTLTATPHGPHR